jgi:hypothetical protein
MTARTDLEKRIEKERQNIADLRSQLEKSEAFMQGLQEALSMLPKEKETRKSKSRPKSKIKGKLRSGSDIERVYNLLLQNTSPMHISQILIGIGKEDTNANRMSLAGSLGKYVRNGKIFARVGRNLFTLKELADAKAKLPLDLPKDFGT